jgi:hypothetical protein
MSFLSFIVLLAIAYLLWRVTDQLPDLIFRLSEIQRDIADIRRRMAGDGAPIEPSATPSAGTSTDDNSASTD